MWGSTGLFRMFSSSVGDQISWLIPSALILLAAGLWLRGRRPRTDLRRAAYLVWGGWLVVTILVFSFMAGIFHEYYTVALAPAIGAVVGMGAVEAWERRSSAVATIALAAATAAAATWSFILLSRTTAYGDWLRISVLAVGMAAALLILATRWMHARAVPVVLAAALVAGLAGPGAYAVSTTAQGHSGSIVTAGPAGSSRGPGGGGGFRGGTPPQLPGQTGNQRHDPAGWPADRRPGAAWAVCSTPRRRARPSSSALSANADRYTWVAAAVGSQTAAGLQLGTQLPGHGHRRLQRLGPEPDARAVPAVRRQRPDPLLRQRRKGIRQPERWQQRLVGDQLVGAGQLHPGDDRRLDVLRPDPAPVHA